MNLWIGQPDKLYKHPEKLQRFMNCLLEDYSSWLGEYNIDDVGVDAQDRYPQQNDNKRGHMALPLIDGRQVNYQYSKGWENSISCALDVPGMLDLVLNFIRPGMELPAHNDSKVWAWIKNSLNDQSIEGYTVSFGLDIPFPDLQALFYNGKKYSWKTGEYVAFDGHDIIHYVNNDTDRWRVTAVMEIDRDYWWI